MLGGHTVLENYQKWLIFFTDWFFCNKLLSFGFYLIFAHSENSFDAPFILYLNCIHDGHHISVLLLLEKCIVNQPRGYGGCSSLNSDVWPRAPPRFLPFSTNCVACGFEKGFSLIALKVGHFLSCIFHQDSLVQKETLDVSLPGVPTSCRVARPRRPPQQPQRLSSSSPSKKQSQKQSH